MAKRSPLAVQAQRAIDRGELLHDNLMAKLVVRRLLQPDARFNGWVLDGFPTTVEQLHELVDGGVSPHAYFSIELPSEESNSRAAAVKHDPVDGTLWDLTEKKPDELTQRRLVTPPF